MTERASELSPGLAARVAGGLYLLVIAGGLFAELIVRSAMIVPGDAAATAANVLAAQPLFRLAFAADLMSATSYFGATFLLYLLFRPVSRNVALLSAFLGTAGSVIMAANLVNFFAPLIVLGDAHSPAGVEVQQSMALAFLRLHAVGYNISILFFAAHLLSLGYLALRSAFLPRFLAVLLALAGACWLINIFAVFLAPRLATYFFFIPMLSLAAEGGLTLWLLLKSVNVERWREAERADDGYSNGWNAGNTAGK